jgi:RNA polymerase sigma-70 factor, ECF subfamily
VKPGEVTQLLHGVRSGDKVAEAELMTLVYRELRKIASHCMRRERGNHTLQPTALVNETYLKLLSGQATEWQSRAHFFAIAAKMMRRILVDHARKRESLKRGGDLERLDMDQVLLITGISSERVLALSEALERLQEYDWRQSAIVELRFFGGLTDEEVGEALSLSARTVKRDWAVAKAWLYGQLA